VGAPIPTVSKSHRSIWTFPCPETELQTEVENPDPEMLKSGTFEFDCLCGKRHTVYLGFG
jgi:hypothetical protein